MQLPLLLVRLALVRRRLPTSSAETQDFFPYEVNASDVRKNGAVQALRNFLNVHSSMNKYIQSKKLPAEESPYPNGQVLIMDEVDGMSDGDVGGLAELVKWTKTSRIPIICI